MSVILEHQQVVALIDGVRVGEFSYQLLGTTLHLFGWMPQRSGCGESVLRQLLSEMPQVRRIEVDVTSQQSALIFERVMGGHPVEVRDCISSEAQTWEGVTKLPLKKPAMPSDGPCLHMVFALEEE